MVIALLLNHVSSLAAAARSKGPIVKPMQKICSVRSKGFDSLWSLPHGVLLLCEGL